MAYPQTIRYLDSLINYEKVVVYAYKNSLKLERVKNFLGTINDPQDSLRCIHICGTKGKGSTCAFISYILRQAGYKVGLYTSPHLSDCRERIRVLRPISQLTRDDFEGMIPKRKLEDLVKRLRPLIEKYNRSSMYGPLSFFEVYTCLAFVYFKEQKVDFAVLETGLGGRLDATNTVTPLAYAITPISYEHTDKLGNTLAEIAGEKAGIIKAQNSKLKAQSSILRLRSGLTVSEVEPSKLNPSATLRIDGKRGRAIKAQNSKLKVQSSIVISAPQEKEAGDIIREKCREAGAKLYEVGKDITYQKTKEGFRVKGILSDYPGLKTRLIGIHQIINATVAIGVIEALAMQNIKVSIGSIRKGLYSALWPGRCEVITQSPLTVLDGAQNIASAKALKEVIKENFKYKKLILILGVSKDKDIKGICSELVDLADEVILTRANNPRATEPEILAQHFNGKQIYRTNNVKEAKARAVRIADREDLVLVTGSLFIVGEFRDAKI